MSLSKAVGNYLSAWEGHTQLEAVRLQQVDDLISRATLSEINSIFNVLSQQNLWVEPLIDLFYNELLGRAMDATFAISGLWLDNDKLSVYIYIGFRDSYPLVTPIFTPITNETLGEERAKTVLRLLIRGELAVLVQVSGDLVRVISAESKYDPLDRITFMEEIPGWTSFKLDLETEEADGFGLIRKMLAELRNRTFGVVDPMTS